MESHYYVSHCFHKISVAEIELGCFFNFHICLKGTTDIKTVSVWYHSGVQSLCST